jgi:uncharacterized protein YecE (DUF72 family)
MSVLQGVGATICNVDSPQHKLSNFLTSDRAYLRLHGRKHWYSYNYSHDELQEIADLAYGLAGKGAKRVYIFFNNDYEGYAPANANKLLDIVKKQPPCLQCPEIVVLLEDAQRIDVELADFWEVDQKLRET